MRAGDTKEAVQLLDLLLEFFADGARWLRGRYHDGHGRHCLIGAVYYLRRKHRLASAAALDYLREALPRRTLGLVYFNDHRCRDCAELRAVILKARALALGEADRERSAAAVKRWLLAELGKERAARKADGADGSAPGAAEEPAPADSAPAPLGQYAICSNWRRHALPPRGGLRTGSCAS